MALQKRSSPILLRTASMRSSGSSGSPSSFDSPSMSLSRMAESCDCSSSVRASNARDTVFLGASVSRPFSVSLTMMRLLSSSACSRTMYPSSSSLTRDWLRDCCLIPRIVAMSADDASPAIFKKAMTRPCPARGSIPPFALSARWMRIRRETWAIFIGSSMESIASSIFSTHDGRAGDIKTVIGAASSAEQGVLRGGSAGNRASFMDQGFGGRFGPGRPGLQNGLGPNQGPHPCPRGACPHPGCYPAAFRRSASLRS